MEMTEEQQRKAYQGWTKASNKEQNRYGGFMEKSYIKSTLDRNSYRNLVYNVTREGRMLEDLTAKEFDEWKAQVAAAEEERRSMKALYQEKSGDYSY